MKINLMRYIQKLDDGILMTRKSLKRSNDKQCTLLIEQIALVVSGVQRHVATTTRG